MEGVGMLALRSALCRMPDRIGPLGVLYRDNGKQPPFFDAVQIEALLAKHRVDLEAGNPPGHRVADEKDFE